MNRRQVLFLRYQISTINIKVVFQVIDLLLLLNLILFIQAVHADEVEDNFGESCDADTCVPAFPITSMSTMSGSEGSVVVITGSNFNGTTGVYFGDIPATFTVNSGTQVTTTVPVGAFSAPVFVYSSAGAFVSGTNFTVAAPSITPVYGTDSDAQPFMRLLFDCYSRALNPYDQYTPACPNSPPNPSIQFQTATVSDGAGKSSFISGTVPAGTNYPRLDFVITGAPLTTQQLADYEAVPPVISSFSPMQGVEGDPVSIYGSDFTGATSVQFNGTAATFTVVSSTQIKTSVPYGASTGEITVKVASYTASSGSEFLINNGAKTSNPNL